MTYHLIIDGFVQGVGFRQFVKSNANKLNVGGWVRNLPDQTVEVMASGNQENLKKLLEICNKGPMLAIVKNIKVAEVDNEQLFDSFDIIKNDEF